MIDVKNSTEGGKMKGYRVQRRGRVDKFTEISKTLLQSKESYGFIIKYYSEVEFSDGSLGPPGLRQSVRFLQLILT